MILYLISLLSVLNRHFTSEVGAGVLVLDRMRCVCGGGGGAVGLTKEGTGCEQQGRQLSNHCWREEQAVKYEENVLTF